MDCWTHCLLFLSKFLNGCISFNIGPINTKLENVANFNMLFSDYMGLVLFTP